MAAGQKGARRRRRVQVLREPALPPTVRYSQAGATERPCVLAELSQGGKRSRPTGVSTASGVGGQFSTVAGLAPRYWRKQMAESARQAAIGSAAGEQTPDVTQASAGPAHSVDEATPELRHHVNEVAADEQRSRHARTLPELLVLASAVGLAVLIGKAFAAF